MPVVLSKEAPPSSAAAALAAATAATAASVAGVVVDTAKPKPSKRKRVKSPPHQPDPLPDVVVYSEDCGEIDSGKFYAGGTLPPANVEGIERMVVEPPSSSTPPSPPKSIPKEPRKSTGRAATSAKRKRSRAVRDRDSISSGDDEVSATNIGCLGVLRKLSCSFQCGGTSCSIKRTRLSSSESSMEEPSEYLDQDQSQPPPSTTPAKSQKRQRQPRKSSNRNTPMSPPPPPPPPPPSQ